MAPLLQKKVPPYPSLTGACSLLMGFMRFLPVLNGQLVENRPHLQRLKRSLSELAIPFEMTENEIISIQKELVAKNQLQEGIVCLQITREAMLRIVENNGPAIKERPFTVEEALAAKEAFITSASTFVIPVIEINAIPIGSGKPSEISSELRKVYIQIALQSVQQ